MQGASLTHLYDFRARKAEGAQAGAEMPNLNVPIQIQEANDGENKGQDGSR
ncbi:MAG: hypothetical protein ACLQUY_26270 [Ktedonobacterales bacterium]